MPTRVHTRAHTSSHTRGVLPATTDQEDGRSADGRPCQLLCGRREQEGDAAVWWLQYLFAALN